MTTVDNPLETLTEHRCSEYHPLVGMEVVGVFPRCRSWREAKEHQSASTAWPK